MNGSRKFSSAVYAQAALVGALLTLVVFASTILRPSSAFPPPPASLAPVYSSQSWRFGIGVPDAAASPRWLRVLGAGWYLNWRTAPNPVLPKEVAYWQMVRMGSGGFWPPAEEIAAVARDTPGLTWLVGNEPDVTAQDNVTPEQYAENYHAIYRALKDADPTSRVGAGGITQVSPLRLAYLDRVLAHYQTTYGEPLPADFWNVHTYILPEQRGAWGAGIPPGFDQLSGQLSEVNNHDDLTLLQAQIRDFRRWMAANGYGRLPLVVTEYGILIPADYGFPPETVIAFMQGTFQFFLTATDPVLGDPTDGGRLVQRWAWFSLAYDQFPAGDLVDKHTGQLTPVGRAYREFVAALP